MRIDIITLFPEFIGALKGFSVVGRAIGRGEVKLVVHNLRDYAEDKYKSVDDHPYGGGVGMLIRVDVMVRAIKAVKKLNSGKTILLTPQGQVYHQSRAKELVKLDEFILICGHYEGFDERIRDYVDSELSVGDYVLTGGEIPAMLVVDSVARLLPGVLGDDESSKEESFDQSVNSGLEYPQYTRPEVFEGKKVPDILLSGNHREIEKWRNEQSYSRTKLRRPDLDN